jgi:hypothetical protein
MRHASSLPFAINCGHASSLASKYPETSEASQEGTGTHFEISTALMGGQEATSSAAKAAVAWVLGLLKVLPDAILRIEQNVVLVDDNAHDYEPIVSGHPDLLIKTANIVHVVDWKRSKFGGTLPPNENPQLISYGLAASIDVEIPFQCHLVFGDDGDDEGNVVPQSSCVFMPEEHPALLDWIRSIALKSYDPCPGDHCSQCYVSQYCQAFLARQRIALAPIIASEKLNQIEMTSELATVLVDKIRLAETWIESAKSVRNAYIKRGGVVVYNGKQAYVGLRKGRDSADVEQLKADGLTKYIKTGKPYDSITWKNVKS